MGEDVLDLGGAVESEIGKRGVEGLGKPDGEVFVLFVIVVAAAEAAVGLGIIILTARNRRSLNVERVDLMKL